jgi:hypothetical protein
MTGSLTKNARYNRDSAVVLTYSPNILYYYAKICVYHLRL